MRARLAGLAVVVALVVPGCVTASDIRPDCRGEEWVLTLAAQAVPSATVLPCLDALLSGWQFAGSQIADGAVRFWLSSDRAGLQAVTVTLTASCDVSGAVEVVPGVDEADTHRFEQPLSLSPVYSANRFYTFPGGCVTVAFRFGTDDPTLVLQADQAISFRRRQDLVERLARLDMVLCGAGAPPCPGGD